MAATSNDAITNVSQLYFFVKNNYLLFEEDAEGYKFDYKTANPAMLNEDGTPKYFYHGTARGDTLDEISRQFFAALEEARINRQQNKNTAGSGGDVRFSKQVKNEGKTAIVSIGSGRDINASYLNGYVGGKYNISITIFNLDSLKKYLMNPSNIVIYEKSKANHEEASGSFVPSLSNDSPYINNVTDSVAFCQ